LTAGHRLEHADSELTFLDADYFFRVPNTSNGTK
jgi:hypothetical protein